MASLNSDPSDEDDDQSLKVHEQPMASKDTLSASVRFGSSTLTTDNIVNDKIKVALGSVKNKDVLSACEKDVKALSEDQGNDSTDSEDESKTDDNKDNQNETKDITSDSDQGSIGIKHEDNSSQADSDQTCQDNVSGKRELVYVDTKSSGEPVRKPCYFCPQPCTVLCRSCFFLYCDQCFEKYHPMLGPYAAHNIVRSPIFNEDDTSLCAAHGLPAKLRCTVCSEMRCMECATTVCALHFQSVFSPKEIQQEKEKIMETLENIQKDMEMISNRLEDEYEKLEFLTLARRERIIQEFASFHDMLYVKEEELLQALEREKHTKQVCVFDGLKDEIVELETKLSQAVSDTIAFVQDENYENFAQKLSSVQDRFKEFRQDQRQYYSSWTKRERACATTPLLDSPVSLFTEKEKLYRSLTELIDGQSAVIQFKEPTLYTSDADTINLGSLIEVSFLPPSSSVVFKFQLLNKHEVIWQTETDKPEASDLLLREVMNRKWRPYIRLVLKLTPTVILHTGYISCYQETIHSSHLMIMCHSSLESNRKKRKEK